MRPTNTLRWLIKRNEVTAAEVQAYAREHDLSLMAAKTLLVAEKPKVLQQWWEAESGAPVAGEWRNVPVVYESIR